MTIATDGGLRNIFKKHIPEAHWQPVETWSTGQGVPDTNYCFGGAEGWIELKQTSSWRVAVSPEQVAWAERRIRAGGRVLCGVRREALAGPRRGDAQDKLYLYDGGKMRTLLTGSLLDCRRLYESGPGGPANWDWEAIRRLLFAPVGRPETARACHPATLPVPPA